MTTTVATITHLGYLYCVECRPAELWQQDKPASVPVYLDSEPHAFEPCDSCKVVANHRFKQPGKEPTMTRHQIETLARQALESLPPDLQEQAIKRATCTFAVVEDVTVVVWSKATAKTLRQIYASSRALALVWTE